MWVRNASAVEWQHVGALSFQRGIWTRVDNPQLLEDMAKRPQVWEITDTDPKLAPPEPEPEPERVKAPARKGTARKGKAKGKAKGRKKPLDAIKDAVNGVVKGR